MWKRISAGLIGAVTICCGILGCGYSVMAFADLGRAGSSIWAAVLGIALLWLLTLGAFGFGANFVKFAVSKQPFRVPPRLRAISLSVLSFFPGFLFSFPPTAFYELLRHPNDQQAPLRAFVVGAVVGLASMLAASCVLLTKNNRAR